MLNTKALAASASAAKVYVEDVFSTWLYDGNGSTQTITNGIDLSGKGGAVWVKNRTSTNDPIISNTDRGLAKILQTSLTASEIDNTSVWTYTPSSTGWSITASGGFINGSGSNYVSWTFRKAAKFFDVVTYTGTGANRTISHNLGTVPGCIIVKRTDTTADWQVYHRSLANTEYLVLNSTAAKATGTTRWNSTTPTSTEFSLGTDTTVNANGGTYVAYLFAHDAGGFGDSGNDSVIKCGSYTRGAFGSTTVSLGWEPQWVLIKESSGASNWQIYDNMRGITDSSNALLNANLSNSESQQTGSTLLRLTSTGFVENVTNNSSTVIYIAIRRGPMKTPTDATKVFSANTYAGGTAGRSFNLGFVPDALLTMRQNTSNFDILQSRLTGLGYMFTNDTTAEISAPTGIPAWDADTGSIKLTTATSVTGWNGSGSNYANEVFSRAPGFFDVVAYTGTGVARTVSHNLGVAPELMIVKIRSGTDNWAVYSQTLGSNDWLALNASDAKLGPNNFWNQTTPTASVFSLGTTSIVNASGSTYITYLFATCPGVSKVGSYTGSGTTKQIDCGFTNGARFVLIKRTDSTGDWYVWDTARGIVSGNDPFLLVNSTAAEDTSTDYIDPLSSGFEISSTAPAAINANGGSYIFLAIA